MTKPSRLSVPAARPEEHVEPLLSAANVSKSFGGVQALDDAGITVLSGEVHVLAGENGSGKSTLLKLLSGALQPDRGDIAVHGETCRFSDVRDAMHRGVARISQELSIASDLSVAENVFMGHRAATRLGRIDWPETERRAELLLRELGVHVDGRRRCGGLPPHQQQMVEIARALSFEARVLLMDEPTSSLDQHDVEPLLQLIRRLADQGTAVVFISHRLPEMLGVGDRFTVLRDGRLVDSSPAHGVDADWLVRRMVGRSVLPTRPTRSARPAAATEPLLSVADVSDSLGRVNGVSLSLHAGEVVGLAGLVGAGRTELLETIAGVSGRASGTVVVDGSPVAANVRSAIDAGVSLVPDDRKGKGAMVAMSVRDNLILSRPVRPLARRRNAQERAVARHWCTQLSIRLADVDQPLGSLSGGNQQKVVIGRCLESKPKILLLDEPTRGVDVGAKAEIYELIQGLAAKGVAVLVASSEMSEILALSQRVLVMHGGHVAGELEGDAISEERIVSLATGAGART